jgi:hypothetical protein
MAMAHDGLKKIICCSYLLSVYYFRIFVAFLVITSESEYSIFAIIQVMSGTLDIFVGLNDLMWTALGALHLDCLRKRSSHILMSH